MTFEKSKNKLRPTLPRASDLEPLDRIDDRTAGRSVDGRFAPGNQLSRDRGVTRSPAKLLPPEVTTLGPDSAAILRDAERHYRALLREVPDPRSQIVRGIAWSLALAQALERHHASRAVLTLGTPEGAEHETRAIALGQRAERLAVTLLDSARVLGPRRAKPMTFGFAPSAPVYEADDADDEASERAESETSIKAKSMAAIDLPDDDAAEPSDDATAIGNRFPIDPVGPVELTQPPRRPPPQIDGASCVGTLSQRENEQTSAAYRKWMAERLGTRKP